MTVTPDMSKVEALLDMLVNKPVPNGGIDNELQDIFLYPKPHPFAVASTFTRSIDAALELIDHVMPYTRWELGKTSARPGMLPGSTEFKYYACVGDWGRPCIGHANYQAVALIIAFLQAYIRYVKDTTS
jgi:hypothetical protein